MVWIHGGGFVSGSGSLPGAGGARLAASQDVVVVSINYRLGVFGFFAHKGLSAESAHGVSGNYGLLDQMAALRWVRRNIAAFGGDPDRVTIFGQSAGGQSVMAHLVSPLSAGLFSAAIAESPRYQDHGVGTWNTLDLATQEMEGEWLSETLGAPDGSGEVEALRRVSAARLLRAAAPAPQPWPLLFVEPTMPSYQPVVDGWVLPEEEWELLRQGRFNRVPLVVGTNLDECNMWTASVKPSDADAVARAAQARVSWFAGPDYPALARQFSASTYGGELPATSRMMTGAGVRGAGTVRCALPHPGRRTVVPLPLRAHTAGEPLWGATRRGARVHLRLDRRGCRCRPGPVLARDALLGAVRGDRGPQRGRAARLAAIRPRARPAARARRSRPPGGGPLRPGLRRRRPRRPAALSMRRLDEPSR